MGEILRQRIKQTRFDSPAHEAMLNLLVAAGHVRQLVENVCEMHDVTSGQYNVLRILRGVHPQGYSRCDIAARLIERAPDVTRLIDRLERRGLVERVRSKEDRRLSITRVTRAGLDLLRRMDGHVAAVHRAFAAKLSGRDMRELSRLCESIYADDLTPATTRSRARRTG